MTGAENDRLALEAVKGDLEALAFLQLITSILHSWDDLIDKDKRLTDAQINECFWQALVVLPRNKFYAKYFAELNPILISAILNWITANQLEDDYLFHGDTMASEIAFIIRSTYCELVIQSAMLIGGFEWGQTISFQVRKLWHNERLAGYQDNLRKQHEDAAELKE